MATDKERKLQQIRKLRDLLGEVFRNNPDVNWKTDTIFWEMLSEHLYDSDVRVCDEHKTLGGCVTSKVRVTTTVDNCAPGSELNTQFVKEAYELGRRRGMR